MSIPLFPYLPQIGSAEILSTKTAIRKTRTGEKRTSLRLPRLELSFEYQGADRFRADLQNLYQDHSVGPWLVPVWSELVRLPSVLPAGTTAITVSELTGDFQEGKSILLLSEDSQEVKEVSSIVSVGQTTTINLALASENQVSGVVPLRIALLQEGLNSTFAFPSFRSNLRFVALDSGNIGESPFPQYLDLDLVLQTRSIRAAIPSRIREVSFFVDNESANPVPQLLKDYLEDSQELTFQTANPSEHWRLKRWLYSLTGRAKPFWLPSFLDDFVLASEVPDDQAYIDVEPGKGNLENFIGQSILLIEEGEDPIPKKIFAADDLTATVGVWRFTIIPTGAGRTLPESSKVSLLKKVRMDTDRIEILRLSSVYSEVSVVVKGVPA